MTFLCSHSVITKLTVLSDEDKSRETWRRQEKTKPSVIFRVKSSAVKEDVLAHVKCVTVLKMTVISPPSRHASGAKRNFKAKRNFSRPGLISQEICVAADSPVSSTVMTGQVRKGEGGSEGKGARY